MNWANRGGNLFGGKYAVLAIGGVYHDTADSRRPAGLVIDQMAAAFTDHLIAGGRMHADRDLVAHGAGRQKNRRFLAQQFGDPPA